MLNFKFLPIVFIICNLILGAHINHKFVVIADPHIYNSTSDQISRLKNTVGYINQISTQEKIRFVVLVGDIAWGSKSIIQSTKDVLDKLNIPYVPVIGDNEIQGGMNDTFCEVFKPQYERLQALLPDFRIQGNINGTTYFTNFAFNIDGAQYFTTDWVSRVPGSEGAIAYSETMNWLQNNLANYGNTYNGLPIYKNKFSFCHHPTCDVPDGPIGLENKYLFSEGDITAIKNVCKNYEDRFNKFFVGHGHLNFESALTSNWIMTKALFEDGYPHIRIVNVETWEEMYYVVDESHACVGGFQLNGQPCPDGRITYATPPTSYRVSMTSNVISINGNYPIPTENSYVLPVRNQTFVSDYNPNPNPVVTPCNFTKSFMGEGGHTDDPCYFIIFWDNENHREEWEVKYESSNQYQGKIHTHTYQNPGYYHVKVEYYKWVSFLHVNKFYDRTTQDFWWKVGCPDPDPASYILCFKKDRIIKINASDKYFSGPGYYKIIWGDGSEVIKNLGSTDIIEHTYPEAKNYQLSISKADFFPNGINKSPCFWIKISETTIKPVPNMAPIYNILLD